jgi:predicted NBD/HSP70 family sugar kinase
MRGCIETVVSAARLDNECAALGFRTMALVEEAENGNPAAEQLWNGFTLGVAHAARILILAVGVDVIAIGGGLSGFGVPLLDRVAKVFDEWSSVSPFLGLLNVRDRLRLVPPEAQAGATGASLLLKRARTDVD